MVEAAAKLQGELIAAQSELKGLEQIYTDSNVRVRAVRARIAELQRQLDQAGGKDINAAGPGSLYPSIRQLPLLGVMYSDLYRRTKIEETVYEILTQRYELAKVQEAKELPVVRVLDAAVIPEKKSFPPRLLIVATGAILSAVFAGLWVFGSVSWQRVDAQDPRKLFAHQVFADISNRRKRITAGVSSFPQKAWRHLHRERASEQPQ